MQWFMFTNRSPGHAILLVLYVFFAGILKCFSNILQYFGALCSVTDAANLMIFSWAIFGNSIIINSLGDLKCA